MVGYIASNSISEIIKKICDESNIMILNQEIEELDFLQYDYVADAVDTVTGKLAIIENAKKAGVSVISSMGAGNKLDPSGFMAADIYETSVCPLARVMRRELKKRGVLHTKVVYSKEPAIRPREEGRTPGSVSFVPSAAGLVIAGEVIRDLCYNEA